MSTSREAAEYDFIVVGTGGGLIGAWAAGRRGLRTLVLEKTDTVGGTTALSGAGIWIPASAPMRRAGIDDSIEAATEYLDAIVGDDAPRELRQAYLHVGPEMVDELEQDAHFGELAWRQIPDYFHEYPGHLRKGRTIFPADIDRAELGDLEPLVRRPLWTDYWGVEPPTTMIGGQALTARALRAAVATGNVTVLTNTPLTDLVIEDGRVVGVKAEHDGQAVTYRAARGVLLAAGGYERNAELRQRHQPPVTDAWTSGAPGNTGDALAAATAIGAGTALLDEAWFAPGIVTPDSRPVFYTMVWSGIWVNSAGQRFMNERLPYDRAGHELMRQQVIPAWWVFDQTLVDADGFRELPVEPKVPGWFDVDRWLAGGALRRADSLGELAAQIGVPADALSATVDEWNGFARNGVDEAFHRGEAPWDRVVRGLWGDHTDGPNPCLGVLAKPPYYAVQVVPTDLGTKGGVTTDADSRVLREDGTVIDGLYAAGNTMAPPLGRIYPGAGGPIATTMIFSYLAAVHAAA